MLFKNKTLSPSDLLPIACLAFSLTLFLLLFLPHRFLPFPLSPFFLLSLLSISVCLSLSILSFPSFLSPSLSFGFCLYLCTYIEMHYMHIYAHTHAHKHVHMCACIHTHTQHPLLSSPLVPPVCGISFLHHGTTDCACICLPHWTVSPLHASPDLSIYGSQVPSTVPDTSRQLRE